MTAHYTYKTTFETGEYYIGKHSTDNLDDGYIGSGVSITDKKADSHTFEILNHFTSEAEAYIGEESAIGDLWKTDANCLNRCPGGKRGYAANRKGKAHTEEWKARIGKANAKPKTGKGLAANRANAAKGIEARIGTKDDAATCAKRSESLKNKFKTNPELWAKPAITYTWQINGNSIEGTVSEICEKFNMGKTAVYRRLRIGEWSKA